jgi:hypothetical protein
MSRLTFKIILGAVLLLFVAVCLGALWAYSSSQEVPAYYQRAKARVAARSAAKKRESGTAVGFSAGSEQKLSGLLTAVTDQSGNSAEVDDWLAQLTRNPSLMQLHEVFSEDDLNAWLAKELPRKFAHCLPPGVSEPQVEFSQDGGRVGFRYKQGSIEGVVTLDVEVAMTGKGSELGVVLRGVSVGSLPLPVGKVLELISDAGNRSQGPSYEGPAVVTWSQAGGDPMALFPGSGTAGGMHSSLQSFALRSGEIEMVIKRQPVGRR